MPLLKAEVSNDCGQHGRVESMAISQSPLPFQMTKLEFEDTRKRQECVWARARAIANGK